MKLLLGTNKGLMLWNDGKSECLLGGIVYGISKFNDRWYCYRTFKNESYVLELSFQGDNLEVIRPVLQCSEKVHQIDFINEKLVIVDTAKNRILIYPTFDSFPTTVLPNGIQTDGYVDSYLHLNSIFCYNDVLYVIAHNQGVRFRKRLSKLYKISMNDYSVFECVELRGVGCHNIYVDNDGILFLDSLNGNVMRNDQYVAKFDGYLRGLSIIDDNYVIGSTAFASSRSDRNLGSILIFDKDLGLLSKNPVDYAIFEIRCFDKPDYSLSNVQQRNTYS
jgi:hypothetical protein